MSEIHQLLDGRFHRLWRPLEGKVFDERQEVSEDSVEAEGELVDLGIGGEAAVEVVSVGFVGVG